MLTSKLGKTGVCKKREKKSRITVTSLEKNLHISNLIQLTKLLDFKLCGGHAVLIVVIMGCYLPRAQSVKTAHVISALWLICSVLWICCAYLETSGIENVLLNIPFLAFLRVFMILFPAAFWHKWQYQLFKKEKIKLIFQNSFNSSSEMRSTHKHRNLEGVLKRSEGVVDGKYSVIH